MKRLDKFVVAWFALLFFISWGLSLARLFGNPFWDKKYALKKMQDEPAEEAFEQGMQNFGKSYYSDLRFPWFLPHVIGAVLWWNLYFFQLIPKVRHWKDKKLHRMLGRFLMIVLFIQMISGVGLAATSDSNIIKLVSYVLAISTCYTAIQAWRYAYFRDIPKHKHWVMRTVGYMQTISLQRFWLLIFIVSHKFGWDGLYPQLGEDAPEEEWRELVHDMFDDSFVMCILHAILSTEWYLATEQQMTESAIDNRKKPMVKEDSSLKDSISVQEVYGSAGKTPSEEGTDTNQAGEEVETEIVESHEA